MKVAIIGAGNMGGAVARGLAGGEKYDVWVSNPSKGKLDAIKSEFEDVHVTTSNVDCANHAEIIILAVKPWKIGEVIAELRPLWERKNVAVEAAATNGCRLCGLGFSDVAIVSMAAGISLAELRELAGPFPAIYKAIPNTAVSVGAGVTFVSRETAYEDLDETICDIFDEMGTTELVDDRMLDAGMAVASCGMAMMMRMLRAMTEGGVELGLYPATALRAAAATMRGAAELIERNGLHPEQEVDRVTTPGGLTIKGLNAMEEAGFTGAVVSGLRACVPKN